MTVHIIYLVIKGNNLYMLLPKLANLFSGQHLLLSVQYVVLNQLSVLLGIFFVKLKFGSHTLWWWW